MKLIIPLFIFLSSLPVSAQLVHLTQVGDPFQKEIAGIDTKYTLGHLIPGIQQGAIPQGIEYLEGSKVYVLSHYIEGGTSYLTILNDDGLLQSTITLKEKSGELHKGHVGGVAATNDKLFVASSGKVLIYKLSDLMNRRGAVTAKAISEFTPEGKASYCAIHNGHLLVGEFHKPSPSNLLASEAINDRKGIRKYARVFAYELSGDFTTPTYVISVRQKVQGIHLTHNRVYLSISYGRDKNSSLAIYTNDLGNPAHGDYKLSNGTTIPLWYLDGENHHKTLSLPPMSEGITMVNDKLAVLMESAALKYLKGGRLPLNRILELDVSEY